LSSERDNVKTRAWKGTFFFVPSPMSGRGKMQAGPRTKAGGEELLGITRKEKGNKDSSAKGGRRSPFSA